MEYFLKGSCLLRKKLCLCLDREICYQRGKNDQNLNILPYYYISFLGYKSHTALLKGWLFQKVSHYSYKPGPQLSVRVWKFQIQVALL